MIARVEALADDPRPPGAEKLEGMRDLYRVLVGDYRILYQVADKVLLVLVVRVGHRRDGSGLETGGSTEVVKSPRPRSLTTDLRNALPVPLKMADADD